MEGDLRRDVAMDIKRLTEIGCYRGIRLACVSHVFLPPLLLLVGDGALGTLPGARVGLAALAPDGQALAVPDATVAADFGQALGRPWSTA